MVTKLPRRWEKKRGCWEACLSKRRVKELQKEQTGKQRKRDFQQGVIRQSTDNYEIL